MVFNNATNQVLVQDKIHSRWPGITLPGGHVDDAESIYESTVREVKEETGLDIFDLEQVGLIHMYNPENHNRRLIFLYRTSHFNGNLINKSDEGKVYWVDIHELENMKLSPNMSEYLKPFLDKNIGEIYISPGVDNKNTFMFY
jgi:8-oxo-dGTP diphosphatase